jgi:hypothetical protein
VATKTGAVYEAKFMLPLSFSEEVHGPTPAHHARMAALSIITGGGKWVDIATPADSPLPTHAADK